MVLLTEGFGLLGVACIASLGMAAVILTLSWIVNPKAPNELKNSPYESGMPLFGSAKIQFDVKFYLYTLLFILFDIEAVFLFPWALAFEKLGIIGIVEVLIFLVILFLGLVYAWRRRALDWL